MLDGCQRLLFESSAHVLRQFLAGKCRLRTRDLRIGLLESIQLRNATVAKRAVDDLQRFLARRRVISRAADEDCAADNRRNGQDMFAFHVHPLSV